MKVKMIKTLEPDKLPNGTLGEVLKPKDFYSHGLHLVQFDTGHLVPIYRNEVEIIEK